MNEKMFSTPEDVKDFLDNLLPTKEKTIIMPTNEMIQDLIPKKKIVECANCNLIHLESERVDDVCPRCGEK